MHSDGGIAISTGAGRQRVADFVKQRETEAAMGVEVSANPLARKLRGGVEVVREVFSVSLELDRKEKLM